MNSGLINVHHNEPEYLIDDLEDLCQYHSWLLCGHKGNKIQKYITQVITEQLDVG